MDEKEIVEAIQSRSELTDRAIQQLYDLCRDQVLNFVIKNNGSTPDGVDLLQDSIIASYEKIISGQYNFQAGKLVGYVFSIARNTWLNRLKKKAADEKRLTHLKNDHNEKDISHKIMKNERHLILKKLFSELGKKCSEVLLLSIFDQMTMNEIAHKINETNLQVIRNRKYKCLKRLKDMIAKSKDVSRYIKLLRNNE